MEQKIDKKIVDEIAHLARLEFNDEAKEQILTDLNRMLSFVNKLNELDTSNIEPLIYMNLEGSELREDVAINSLSQAEALKNAPHKDSDYFKVPKVIDNK